MKINILLYCFITAFCFGFWPVIMKTTGLKPNLTAFILTSVTLIIVAIPFLNNSAELKTSVNDLTIQTIAIAVTAGLLNGIGIFMFQKIIASPVTDISKSYTIIIVSQLPVIAISSIILLGDPLTLKKLAGFITAAITILLLA